jgi:hypothetical protein
MNALETRLNNGDEGTLYVFEALKRRTTRLIDYVETLVKMMPSELVRPKLD